MAKLRYKGTKGELRKAIAAIDLEPMKLKLRSDEGPGWSEEHLALVEQRYRNFLFLTLAYPNKTIVPSKDVDTFWHAHILDTRKYAADCKRYFGGFFHHFPYLGLRGEADKVVLHDSFAETLKLHQKEFGEPFTGDVGGIGAAANCDEQNCRNCVSDGVPSSGRAQTCSSCSACGNEDSPRSAVRSEPQQLAAKRDAKVKVAAAPKQASPVATVSRPAAPSAGCGGCGSCSSCSVCSSCSRG